MENGYDLNLIRRNFVEHRKRKTPNNGASESSVNNRIQVWIAKDSRKCVVDPFHEFEIQIWLLVGIPLAGLSEFGIRFGSEPNHHVRFSAPS